MTISINYPRNPLSSHDRPSSVVMPPKTCAGASPAKVSLRIADGFTSPVPSEASPGFIERIVGASNPDVKTIADALQFVQQHNLMSEEALTAATSAVGVLATVLGRAAEQIPAAPKQLRPLIKAAAPAQHGLWGKRWSNATHFVRAILRACKLHAPIVGSKRPSDPTWATMIEVLPKKRNDGGMYSTMTGFGCWCSDASISPEKVTEQTLKDFLDYRETQTLTVNIARLGSVIRLGWNGAVRARLSGWPARELLLPRHPGVDALPPGSFPTSLSAEIDAYLVKRMCPKTCGANQRPWRLATAQEARKFPIRAANLIAQRLGGAEHVRSLSDIVTEKHCEFVLGHLYERAGNVWRGYSLNFANCLLVVARDFVNVDKTLLSKLEHLHNIIVRRVGEQRRPGLSERVDQLLMPFQDPKIVKRLFELPDLLYRTVADRLNDDVGVDQGTNAKKRKIRTAQLHEKALMLDLLQHDPVHRYNIAAINYETDFVRDERGGIKGLQIASERAKNGVGIDTSIDPDLAKHLAQHLTDHRPHLRGSGSPWLFPSPNGGSRSPHNVTKAITQITQQSLGVTCSPQLLRHIIATQLYLQNPANGAVIQRMLRHTRPETTEQMYAPLSNASSNAVWQTRLERFRQAAISDRAPKTARAGRNR